MTSLRENELVKRYFECPFSTQIHEHEKGCNTLETMALRVLCAMQEKIEAGDKYLHIGADGWTEEGISNGETYAQYHYGFLRLPSRFQSVEPGKEWCGCTYCALHKPQPPTDKCDPLSQSNEQLTESIAKQNRQNYLKPSPVEPEKEEDNRINDLCDEFARCCINKEFVSASWELRNLFALSRKGIIKRTEEKWFA